MPFDIDKIRRENPLPDYAARRGVQLKQNGREYVGLSPFATERTPSFTIYPARKGDYFLFQCFSSGQRGDVIDFTALYDGVTFAEACEILGGKREPRRQAPEAAPPKPTSDPYKGFKVLPVPAKAKLFEPGVRTVPIANPKRWEKGQPLPMTAYTPRMVHPVRTKDGVLQGYVLRVEIDGRKFTPTIMWAKGPGGFEGWTHYPWPEPRPMYGEHKLNGKRVQVLLVEGEKCVDAATAYFKDLPIVPLTWIGGGKAYQRTSFGHLEGRSVALWMDADEAGEQTQAGLIDLLWEAGVASLKVIRLREGDATKKGWDIADAIEEGLDLIPWMKERAEELVRPEPKPKPEPKPEPKLKVVPQAKATRQEKPEPESNVLPFPGGVHPPPPDRAAGGQEDWKRHCIMKPKTMDEPQPKLLQNAMAALRYEGSLKGLFRYDEFSHRIMVTRAPPWEDPAGFEVRASHDGDLINCRAKLERLGLTPTTKDTASAMTTVARENKFNEVQDYLLSLRWDGVRRIQGEIGLEPWLTEYCGAEATEINRAYGLRWFVGLAGRALKPGIKLDTMLVVEGPQGLGKSTMFEALATLNGRRYFTDAVSNLNSRDTIMQIAGTLIAEVSEMAGFTRYDMDMVKAHLSSRVDRIRKPYATDTEEMPRSGVMVGTINPKGNGYLADATGLRRFWTVSVGVIDKARLEQDREQLWAEAVHLFQAGEQWWLTDEEQALAAPEAEKRQVEEVWDAKIEDFLHDRREVRIGHVLDGLGLPIDKQNRVASDKVAEYLRRNGWTMFVKRHHGSNPLKWFKRP